MTDVPPTCVFLCGADMAPGHVRRDPRTADSRFVGIGSVPATALPGLPLPPVETVWGIVVTLPDDAGGVGDTVPVELPDGRVIAARVLTDAASFGPVAEAVAEAWYWELPLEWRQALEGVEG